ncbi:MAG: hypothetical protein ACRCY4_06445 [Brevinema sp.]
MILALRMVLFAVIGSLVAVSSVVFAFLMDAWLLSRMAILMYSFLFAFIILILLGYPFVKLFVYLGVLNLERKQPIYGGSFARLRK